MKTKQILNDKRFEKVHALVLSGMKLGPALKKSKLSYPSYRSRLLKLKKKNAKINEITQRPNKKFVHPPIELERVESVFFEAIKALKNLKDGSDFFDSKQIYDVDDIVEILHKVEEKITSVIISI